MPKILIVDIDGTITQMSDARPTTDAEWLAMYENAEPAPERIAEIEAMRDDEDAVFIVTGRKESARDITEAWLNDIDFAYDDLVMRPNDDNRPAVAYKAEIYSAIASHNPGIELVVFDDDADVRRMARDAGYTVKGVKMPYYMESVEGEFCVFKEGEAIPLECYDDRGSAEDYLIALRIATADENYKAESDTHIPPVAVAENARMALEVRAEMPPSMQGMTLVGLARANQLANRRPVSVATIRRMLSYFERHEVDKQGATWDEKGKGWQAWMGWGGDEGWAWAREIIAMEDEMDSNSNEAKATKKGGEWIAENPDMTFTVYVKDSQFLIYKDGARLLWTDNSMDAFDSIDMSIEDSYKKSIKASRRHSEADMKLIRAMRKQLKMMLEICVELGDDGYEDEEESAEEQTEMETGIAEVVDALDDVRTMKSEEVPADVKAFARRLMGANE